MPSKPDESGYADVNGVKLYYAVNGTGDPLILLHGGLGHSEMMTEGFPRERATGVEPATSNLGIRWYCR